MTNTGDQYELCMRAENVHLPKQGYFGVTAATGGLAGAFEKLPHTCTFTSRDRAKHEKSRTERNTGWLVCHIGNGSATLRKLLL